MNERIKQLWSKAAESNFGDSWEEQTAFMSKFAELIVEECRDIVEQDMKLAHIQMIPLTLEKYANGRLKEKIQEHFGV